MLNKEKSMNHPIYKLFQDSVSRVDTSQSDPADPFHLMLNQWSKEEIRKLMALQVIIT
jgi:hypothetical protein